MYSDYGRLIAAQLGCNLFCLDKIVLANIATHTSVSSCLTLYYYVSFNHREMTVIFYTGPTTRATYTNLHAPKHAPKMVKATWGSSMPGRKSKAFWASATRLRIEQQ